MVTSKEPRYVSVDDDGREYGKVRPKWMSPAGKVQQMMLAAVDRKYYKDRAEQTEINRIAKQAVSLTTGIESEFPLEWIENCCEWVRKKCAKREMVQMKGLISLIADRDKKTLWMDRNRDKYGKEDNWDDIAKRYKNISR